MWISRNYPRTSVSVAGATSLEIPVDVLQGPILLETLAAIKTKALPAVQTDARMENVSSDRALALHLCRVVIMVLLRVERNVNRIPIVRRLTPNSAPPVSV